MRLAYVVLAAAGAGALLLLLTRNVSARYIEVMPGLPVEGCADVEYLEVVSR